MQTFTIDNVLIILFRSKSQLSLTLSRVHEAYEGRKLKGPLKGVNIPLPFYLNWYSVNVLSDQEQSVHDLIIDSGCEYMIASLMGDQSSLYHEWAHAYYYLNPQFQSIVKELFDSLPDHITKVVIYDLKMKGYSSVNFLDEFQAYVIENPNEFGKKCYNVLVPIHHKLRDLCKRPKLNL
jgi:bifunctional DNase/RNase